MAYTSSPKLRLETFEGHALHSRLQHTGNACLQVEGIKSGLLLTSIGSEYTAWLVMHSVSYFTTGHFLHSLIVRTRQAIVSNYSLNRHTEYIIMTDYNVYMLWQSQVEIEHFCCMFWLCSKHSSKELLLRVGLIPAG